MAKKELVKMTKEGEEPIMVSPLVVENHKQLGWKVVGEEPAPAAAKAEGAPEVSKRKRGGRKTAKASEAAPSEGE